jgi:hypothetical protein
VRHEAQSLVDRNPLLTRHIAPPGDLVDRSPASATSPIKVQQADLDARRFSGFGSLRSARDRQ